MKFKLIIYFCLFLSTVFAQQEAIKSSSWGIGLTNSLWALNSYPDLSPSRFTVSTKQSISPMGLNLGYQKTLRKKFSLFSNVEFRPLKSLVENYSSEYLDIGSVNWDVNHNNFIISNLFEIDFGTRYYTHNAPFDFFFSLNANASLVTNKVTRSVHAFNYIEEIKVTYDAEKFNTALYGIEFGIGKSIGVSNKHTVDIGINASFINLLMLDEKQNPDTKLYSFMGSESNIQGENIVAYNHKFLKSEIFTFYLIFKFQNINL